MTPFVGFKKGQRNSFILFTPLVKNFGKGRKAAWNLGPECHSVPQRAVGARAIWSSGPRGFCRQASRRSLATPRCDLRTRLRDIGGPALRPLSLKSKAMHGPISSDAITSALNLAFAELFFQQRHHPSRLEPSFSLTCSSASVGFCPICRRTGPSSLALMTPSWSVSNRKKASWKAPICSSVRHSVAILTLLARTHT